MQLPRMILVGVKDDCSEVVRVATGGTETQQLLVQYKKIVTDGELDDFLRIELWSRNGVKRSQHLRKASRTQVKPTQSEDIESVESESKPAKKTAKKAAKKQTKAK